MTTRRVAVKRLPEHCDRSSRKCFVKEIKEFVETSDRGRLVLDLSPVQQLDSEAIDVIFECVDHTERGDSELAVAGASPETAVLLELTRATSVLNLFPSVSEAINGTS